MFSIESFKERLLETGVAIPELLRGCSEEEIAELEHQAGARLPATYRAFLQVMGKEAGNLFRGTDMFYRHLPGLRVAAVELLANQGIAAGLPADAFVFSLHQGYEFMYFRLSAGDDPPIYQYVEGNKEPIRQWEHFSSFLQEGLDQHLEARQAMID